MVEYIDLEIPLSADLDNPIEDADFMAKIGTKKVCGFPNWFKLKNAVTGTRFTFQWYRYDYAPKSKFTLRRHE